MALSAGDRLGPYEILEPLGAGGMGEVYRATDTKLGRAVAIKILPAEVAKDPERLQRFEREAHLLASLNHPHIAAIHGLEESNGNPFLVLELVEGEDLKQRLDKGRIPVIETLEIATQIAEALEEAHEKGIVHRDLKPANVKLTPDGKVKVLDFGLAKAFAGDSGPDSAVSDFTQSPTLAQSGTAAGVILGTASYMSPEQASGRPVDKRADIWAFGVVLFEMLTGQRLFGGETVSEVLASVIKDEPDWTKLPTATPPALHKLLRRCLEKKPQRRLHDIADARLEIDEALHEPVEPFPAAGSYGSRGRERLAWLVAGLAVATAIGTVWRPWNDPASRATKHLAVNVPPQYRIAKIGGASVEVALSRDGNLLVFTAERAGEKQLFLRRLDQPRATPLPGTEGGYAPFFSPDAEWVGFCARDGTLQKVSVAGGAPVEICDPRAGTNPGASWGPDDTILFSPGLWKLWRVSADGGTPEKVTDQGRWPQILPGGKHVLASARDEDGDNRPVVISLETGESRLLERGRAGARYLPSGHLVYGEAGSLMAVGFDLGRLELRGSPRPVLDDVYMHPFDLAYFNVSDTGTLAYVPGRNESTLEWVDRDGRAKPLVTQPGDMVHPRVAPDGRRIAVARVMPRSGQWEVWVYDAASGTGTRLGPGRRPIWTPDSTRVAFRRPQSIATRSGTEPGIFWQPADGSAPAQRLETPTAAEEGFFIDSCTRDSSPEGQGFLACRSRTDLWALPTEGDPIRGPWARGHAVVSPDGRWVAYDSEETGQAEVYVAQYPGHEKRRRISTDGGREPLWSPDGRELFYRVAGGDRIMAVSFGGQAPGPGGAPRLLLEGNYVGDSVYRNYDIAPDGHRFLMIKRSQVRSVNVVLNWFEELKAKMGEVEE